MVEVCFLSFTTVSPQIMLHYSSTGLLYKPILCFLMVCKSEASIRVMFEVHLRMYGEPNVANPKKMPDQNENITGYFFLHVLH